jgi:hypothetical protein
MVKWYHASLPLRKRNLVDAVGVRFSLVVFFLLGRDLRALCMFLNDIPDLNLCAWLGACIDPKISSVCEV